MTQVLPLSNKACYVVVQGLLDLAEHTSFDLQLHLIRCLRSDSYTAVTPIILNCILQNFPQKLTNDILSVLVPPHLTDVNLKDCTQISAYGVYRLFRRCCGMQRLGLPGCHQLMVPDFFHLIGRTAQGLTSLCVADCDNVNSKHIKAILSSFPNLQHLDVSGCREVKDDAFLVNIKQQAHLVKQAHVKGGSSIRAEYLCKLTRVDLAGCRLTSDGVYNLTTLCGPYLQTINLTNTRVDCLALWALCGYTICSVVHLACKMNASHVLKKIYNKKRSHYNSFIPSKKNGNDTDTCESCTCKLSFPLIEKSVSCLDLHNRCIYHDYCESDDLYCNCRVVQQRVHCSLHKGVCCNYINNIDCIGNKSEAYAQEKYMGADFSQDDRLVQIYVPDLHSVEVLGMEFPSRPLGQYCLQDLVRHNPRLMRLHVFWRCLEDSTVAYIAKHAPNLTSIAMIECVMLEELGMKSLYLNCPRIQYLDLEGVVFITDMMLIPLLRSCKLKFLSLIGTKITDETLKVIATECCQELKHLDVSWCEDITAEGLNLVFSLCLSLHTLALQHTAADEEGLLNLGKHCTGMHNLKASELEIAVTDNLLCLWSVHLRNLQKLDLGWNTNITDIGITAIVINLVNLQELRLAGLFRITSAPFMPIITDLKSWRRCQGLLRIKLIEQEKLALSGDQNLSSDEEYEEMCLPQRSSSYAPNLHYLYLACCHQVNEYHIAELVAVCRGTLTATNTDVNGQPLLPNWINCHNGLAFELNPNEIYANPEN